jgi:hypothetical protein
MSQNTIAALKNARPMIAGKLFDVLSSLVLCTRYSFIAKRGLRSKAHQNRNRHPADWPQPRQSVGINLAPVGNWSSEIAFVDLFRRSGPWISRLFGKTAAEAPFLELDDCGWVKSLRPDQYADAVIFYGRRYPPGKFTCLYEGQGEIGFPNAVKIIKTEPGRIEIKLNPWRGDLIVRLKKTNLRNYVRNIRIIPASYEAKKNKAVFTEGFLERCQHFQVYRFMDWMRINNSSIRDWHERPKISDHSQALKGVALEHMVELCNIQQAAPWFCIPHLASNDYVQQFAEQVFKSLSNSLPICVEYSNEMWNQRFIQAKHAVESGRKARLSDNHFLAGLSYYSKRSQEIFEIWRNVFGSSSSKLLFVLGSIFDRPQVTDYLLSGLKKCKGRTAVAVAAYLGRSLGSPEAQHKMIGWNVSDVLGACQKEILRHRLLTRKHAEIAASFGVDLFAYEGGQHLVPYGDVQNCEQLVRLFHKANRHPAMAKLYFDYLSGWKEIGGKLFVLYNSMQTYSEFGSWGLLEDELQRPSGSAKWRGVMAFLRDSASARASGARTSERWICDEGKGGPD